MRRVGFWLFVILVLSGLGWGGFLGWQYLSSAGLVEAPFLAAGHQEVAWIAPATNGDSWERLVAALKNLEKDWPAAHAELPQLHVSFKDAFPEQTAAVPQIALHCDGAEDAKLWIRWYKLGGEGHRQHWLEKLRKRDRAPLAILGGDTSDRALGLAKRLQATESQWAGSPPVFLIISATAIRYYPGDNQSTQLTQNEWPKLMDAYKGMSFRFCFHSERIAETVMDFVQENPQVWPNYQRDAGMYAAMLTQGRALDATAILAAAGQLQPTFLYTLAWRDDRYSQDLADQFWKQFSEIFYEGSGNAALHNVSNYVQYSVGDFYQPNPSELQAVGLFLADRQRYADHHQLLAVPTGMQQARRFLHAVSQQAPAQVQNIVVVSGDSISFNNVYRDRDVAWNVLDLPIPLVFFSHRNPVDESAGFGEAPNPDDRYQATGTQDLLLLRDVVEAFIQAAWAETGWTKDSRVVQQRLRELHWHQGHVYHPDFWPEAVAGQPLFDAEGNRRPRTGEHVVWLQPTRAHGQIMPKARLSVWRIDPQIADELTWKLTRPPLQVEYNQGGVPEARPGNGD